MKVKNKENGQKRKYPMIISMKSIAVILSVGKFLFHSSLIIFIADPKELVPAGVWMESAELRLRSPAGP